MSIIKPNKKKILNDPVYGFVTLKDDFILDIIDHPWFQRLRRISQLGLSHLVYPGAVHNRFHHAIGAMNLMQEALEVLQQKGIEITPEEELGAILAILLHDVGHGPFSHALEHSIVTGISHEELTQLIMNKLNKEFDGKLTLAIEIFSNTYPKTFLHQLVSSQLDMDRLDYLSRDSFYTGVSEGIVGTKRIIKMLNVANDRIVVEEKGIYSIEKYIVARRLMYWQVYLHKTVLSAEFMLMNILKRAKELVKSGISVFSTPSLLEFLTEDYNMADIKAHPELLEKFCHLDDFDVMASIKEWQQHSDRILSYLSRSLLNRKLFKIKLSSEPWPNELIEKLKANVAEHHNLTSKEANYFIMHEMVDNKAYSPNVENIMIKMKDGTLEDLASASDHFNISALSAPVEKWFLAELK